MVENYGVFPFPPPIFPSEHEYIIKNNLYV